MKKFDKKKHDERFFYFKKELIRNGAYFDFIDELCRFDDFNKFVKLNKNSNLLDYYHKHERKDLLVNKNSPWINYDYFFTDWNKTLCSSRYWFSLIKKIGSI